MVALNPRIELNRNVLLPNLLTIGNGICGFVALATLSKVEPGADTANAQNLFSTAAWLVFLGMVFDVFDGKVARVSGGSTALGAQLDSLCDLVTFGLVPAFMIMQMNLGITPRWDKVVTVFSLAYFLGATLRLARFTAENAPDETAHLAFKGLPTPGAAGCVASLVIFHTYITDFAKPELVWLARYVPEDTLKVAVVRIPEVMPFLGLLLGFAMVSNRLVFDHAGSWVFGKKHTFDFFAYVIFGAVLAAVVPEVVLPLVFFGYLFYKPSLLLFRFVFPVRKTRSARSSEGRDHGE